MTSTETIAITGLIVAIYGAALSTFVYRRDRVDIVIKVRPHMKAEGRYTGMKLTIITATNRGKRPVTIQGFAARHLNTRAHSVFYDVRPTLPAQITESQTVSAFVDEANGVLDNVETYYAWDSVGREFTLHKIGWFRRYLSERRRRAV
jgi:hypothetical protein